MCEQCVCGRGDPELIDVSSSSSTPHIDPERNDVTSSSSTPHIDPERNDILGAHRSGVIVRHNQPMERGTDTRPYQ